MANSSDKISQKINEAINLVIQIKDGAEFQRNINILHETLLLCSHMLKDNTKYIHINHNERVMLNDLIAYSRFLM